MTSTLTAKLRSPLKWHGGKRYLAPRIVELFPPKKQTRRDGPFRHYVEPFFGSGAVLFNKVPDDSEVINDIHDEVANFFGVLRNQAKALERRLSLTAFAEVEFERAAQPTGDNVERAARFFIRNRMSRQALSKDFVTLVKTRPRRGMQDHVSAWLSAIEGLAEAAERLRRIVVLNRDACDVISQQDGEFTLFYCDPPYLHETRTATNAYEYEMSEADHVRLLETLTKVQGNVILSGYASDLYQDYVGQWRRVDIEIVNHASSKRYKNIKTESIWMNYRV